MIYFISDTHFGHKNIIKYCNRPFDSVDHMNRKLTENWNSVVQSDDLVYHVGDFSLGNNPSSYFSPLQGKKFLVKGNHDGYKITQLPWDGVFQEAIHPFIGGDWVFMAHLPPDAGELMELEECRRVSGDSIYRLYGHVHDKPVLSLPKWCICVCVEMPYIDYTPRTWEHIKEATQ